LETTSREVSQSLLSAATLRTTLLDPSRAAAAFEERFHPAAVVFTFPQTDFGRLSTSRVGLMLDVAPA
jgi:hypothetical protein